MMFDAEKVKEACVLWIREFFKENGPDCNAVIGISGGKDSSVVGQRFCHYLSGDCERVAPYKKRDTKAN